MVVVADESVVDQVQDLSCYEPWIAQFKSSKKDKIPQDKIVVVAGFANIYAGIFETIDENALTKSVIFGKDALASQLYYAVSHLYEEYPSPESFNLVLVYNDKKYPLKFENVPITDLGLEFSSNLVSFDNDNLAFASLNVKHHSENGNGHDTVDGEASGRLETLVKGRSTDEEDGVIEFRVIDMTVQSSIINLAWAFLVSSTTTVRDLYDNIVFLHARNSPENSIKLQYIKNSKFDSEALILSSDKYIDKTMKEAGFDFKESNKILTLELINTSVQVPRKGLGWNDYACKDTPFKFNNSTSEEDAKKSEKTEREIEIKPEMTYVGLVNQAMTCYLNSLLQALYMTPEFRNALYNWEYIDGSEKDEANSIPYQLQKLFLNLQTSTKAAVETTSLTKSFGWDSTEAWQQHDIQELCRVMFDALEQKFKNTEQADLINRLYEGKMMDYVKCLECSTEKLREDTFLDIPLPVKPFGSNVAYNSVEEAMRAFVQPETLDGVNQYFCETCNKKCDAHKGLKFTKFPYLLTLHLKRFDFDYNTFHRIKLNDKVTFPDILNLNSFIPSDNQESPTAEEDAGVGVKYDDSSTTDSANLDECPPCAISENGISSESKTSEHIGNNEQDDDEGIDMSNGPSTSSTEHSQESDNRHRAMSGPYQYELFSIMIHSGSASGGHYYAYIKDFRTNEWLCFNDQNVTPITYEDIQKTYGGGPTRGYYSGAYSSSTNAYMLMYRQIDPQRNTLPIEVDSFPKHIQELLIKMKEYEEERRIYERSSPMFKIKVYFHHPYENTMKSRKIFPSHDETLTEMLERVHKTFDLESIVDIDQCRLVTYNPTSETICRCFDGHEHKTLGTLFQKPNFDMLLEIRKKDEKFENYTPGGIGTKVFSLDCGKMEVIDGPIYVRAVSTQTVMEYKEQVGKITNINPKHMLVVIQKYPTGVKFIENNDNQLTNEGFISGNRVFVTSIQGVNDEQLKNVVEPSLRTMLDNFEFIISLYAELPDMSKEVLEELSIPSLESHKEKEHKENKEVKVEKAEKSGDNQEKRIEGGEGSQQKEEGTGRGDTASASSSASSSASASASGSASADGNGFAFTSCSLEKDDWQEQSNSEDSSLSDSDRTLVGDASEDDDFGLANVDGEWYPHQNSNNKEDWELDQDDMNYFFKATPYTKDDKKYLRLLVDKRMKFSVFRKHLEPYVGVPTECFKVVRQAMDSNDTDYTWLTTPLRIWEDGEKISIKLGRALRMNEFRMRVYQLNLGNSVPYSYLFEWTVSKDSTVGALKKQLLGELKRKFNHDISFERCRLRKKNYQIPSKVLLNDQFIRDVGLQSQCELILQELAEDDPVTNTNQIVVMVRRAFTGAKVFGPVQEIVLQEKSYTELAEKIAELSSIPIDNLQVTKGKWPGDAHPSTRRLWTPVNKSSWSSMSLEDVAIIFYRDFQERGQANTPEEVTFGSKNIVFANEPASMNRREIMRARVSNYGDSPRRERALKIYLDDK